MIHPDEGREAFALIDRLLDELAPEPEYRRLYATALHSIRDEIEGADAFFPVDLPFTVAGLLGCKRQEALAAAAAATSLWIGADLMDDLADGQLPERWAATSAHELMLVSTNLLSTFPHLLAASLVRRKPAAEFADAVSRTLFAMSCGQSADLRSAQAVTSIDEYLAMVRRKAGAEFALFAAAPAILSGRDEQLGDWVAFGTAYGTLCQVFSDTVSAVAEGPRNDLLQGKRSLPVLRALEQSRDEEHFRLVADLDSAAAGDQAALQRVIGQIERTGSLRFSFERIEMLRLRAARALPVDLSALKPDHPMRRLLRQFSIL